MHNFAVCKVNLYSSRDHTKSMCASNERRNENEERKRTAWCWLLDGGWSMEKEVESSMNVFKSCLRRSTDMYVSYNIESMFTHTFSMLLTCERILVFLSEVFAFF